jgi:hypothetical protein
MVWIITALALLLLLIGWLLLSPIEMDIDTRVPHATFQWLSIGQATIVYENEEWFVKVRVLLFHKQWLLSKLFIKSARKKKQAKKIPASTSPQTFNWHHALKMLSTFRIIDWKLAVDGNEHLSYAMMFPMNFMPYLGKHVYINFQDQTYFVLRIRNQPWRMVYAWIR